MHCDPRLMHGCLVAPSNQSAAVPVTRFGLLFQATVVTSIQKYLLCDDYPKWLKLCTWPQTTLIIFIKTSPPPPRPANMHRNTRSTWACSLPCHSTLNFTSCEGWKHECVKKGPEMYIVSPEKRIENISAKVGISGSPATRSNTSLTVEVFCSLSCP